MRRPRLVASDVDGTLLGPDGHVSPRTRAAVARVEEGGALFVLVTGRPPRWLAPLRDELDHHGVAVCANGAVLYDLASGETLREDALPGDVAEAMVRRLREQVPGVAFAVEGTSGFGHEPAYRPRWDLSASGLRVEELDVLLAEPRYKLLVRTSEPGATSDSLLAAVHDAVGDLVTATHSAHGDDALVEVSAAGVSKGTALERFASERGVRAPDVVAFGDMPNDLPMLVWAGRGYAMGNAHPQVLAAADEVAPSNADDGLAAVLEQLFG